jgi:hypothetical protein
MAWFLKGQGAVLLEGGLDLADVRTNLLIKRAVSKLSLMQLIGEHAASRVDGK